ncbi:GntR family transcriptional regulator [soil metagenome]
MKSDSQAKLAYSEIRRQILIMQLIPSERIKEDMWAKRLSVNRMAIREALTRLLGEGLVYIGDKSGYFVTAMSAKDLKEIWEIREVLELAAINLAINKITKEKLDELYKICDDFTNLSSKGYTAGSCEADIRFHEKLIEYSGNTRLAKAYHYCHIPLFHQRLGKAKEYMDDYKLTDSEHRKIVEALKKKDAAAAQKILKEHFKRGAKMVLGFDND